MPSSIMSIGRYQEISTFLTDLTSLINESIISFTASRVIDMSSKANTSEITQRNIAIVASSS